MKRRRNRKGSELLQFTLVLVPMLSMIIVTLDIAWAIFAQGTLQWAVRYAAKTGSTMTAANLASGACLTDTVKTLVQNNSLGLVSGTAGRALIKVNYLQPPAVGSSSASTDVSTLSTGDTPGNIIQVSVQGFSLPPLVPRIFSLSSSVDHSASSISVYSADLIQSPGAGGVPCIGTAP